MFRSLRSALPVIFVVLAVNVAAGANEGQPDLDKATQTKINAATISDLGEVIRLCESALEKGLDEPNTDFANKILASALLQRSSAVAKHIFAISTSPADFKQRRQFALADLEKATALNSELPEAFLVIARLQLLPGGDAEQARAAIEKSLALGLEEPADRARALLLRAGLQESFDKKLADLDEAVRLTPDNADAVRARGLVLADSGKLEPALADINKAIELEPDDGPTYEAKAIVLDRLDKTAEAIAVLDKARQLNPDSIMPLLQRARIYSRQGKLDAALDDINRALSLSPSNTIALVMRANVHQERGDTDKAMADVDRAMKLNPQSPTAMRTRAVLLADSQQYDQAIAELEKIRKLVPKDTLTLMQLAILYSAQKKTDRAIDAYSALLAEDPDELRALRGRADLYLNAGRQAEAIADYEKAMLLQPKDPGILNNLAWVLATSPDDETRNGNRAIELAIRACEASGYKLAYTLSTLAAAYAETGDYATAIKWSKKAVKLGDKDHQDSLERELESYKAGRPWREWTSEE